VGIITYPGDLILRPGRRVCRRGEWTTAVPIDAKGDDSWLCGTLSEIKEDMGIVEVFSSGKWSYPLDLLEVDHTQEDMIDEQYLWGLLRIRDIILGGCPLQKVDSTQIGNKYTHVSWGLEEDYGSRPKVWPIGIPRRMVHQYCPLDIGQEKHLGCFYRCMAFQHSHLLTAGIAVELYNDAIDKISNRIRLESR
jgi:hypothetical protein